MKNNFYADAADTGGMLFFWISAVIFLLLTAVFIVKQITFVPVDTQTVADLVLNESKGRASSFKRFFPKPYGVQELHREH
jgi:tellurite resistance protein TehA-like permease